MFQPARGTRDFLPEEMLRRNWIFDKIRNVFEAYGYEPLGTPAFESWDMLKIKSGEDAINQIYYFRDKSDRELGLRFEWTASLCRVISAHRELPSPFKRYSIGPVWRYERPSEKRFREFWQADADIVGVENTVADTEALAVAVDCLKSIGFEGFTIRLNDRRILEAFVDIAGLPKERTLEIFRAVDKLGKIGVEGVREELAKIGASLKASNKLLELSSLKGKPKAIIEEAQKTLEGSKNGLSGCEALSSIVEYSTLFGIEPCIAIDFSLARGLDYYTGPVFEIYAEGFEDYGSIAGGGRYDELIGLFGGKPTPATGVSLGIERIFTLLEKRTAFEGLVLGPRVYVASTSESVRGKAIEVAQILRRADISTDLDMMGRSLKRQLDYANNKGFKKVVIVGERELANGQVSLKDMRTSEQRIIKIEDLKDKLLHD